MLRILGKAVTSGVVSSTRQTIVAGALSPNSGATRAYHERVIDHFENPRNVGSLDKNDDNVGTGLVGAPACGDVSGDSARVCVLCCLTHCAIRISSTGDEAAD
jgi:hypothetical protein